MIRHRRPGLVAAIATLSLLLVAADSAAWDNNGKWDTHVVGYKINPSNKEGLTNTEVISALRDAAKRWTTQSRAAFRWRYDGTTAQTTHGNDSKNIVLFRDAKKSATSSARATTYWWLINGKIVDADIVYWGKAASFITGSDPCNNQVYVENTGIHEFGHALGLQHSSVSGATMWSTSPACSKTHLSLHADDKAGVEALYKCSTNAHCNDADICTSDTCGSNKLCTRSAITNCCTSASQCNDGKACTTDTCSANKCKHTAIAGCCTSASQCNDGKACTKDTCSANKCKHTAIAGCCTSASQCDDSKVCTNDTCSANKCKHTAISGCCTAASQCNDSKVCTKDTCSANKCKFTAISGCCTAASQCNDSKVCTKDTCSANTCKFTAISGCCTAASQCGDSDPCTKDSCSANTCKHVAIPGCGKPDSGVLPPKDSGVTPPKDAGPGKDTGLLFDGGHDARPGDGGDDGSSDGGDDGARDGAEADTEGGAGGQAQVLEGGCGVSQGQESLSLAWMLGLMLLLLWRPRRRQR
jgi:MYXO-CTERM domain-containing protein